MAHFYIQYSTKYKAVFFIQQFNTLLNIKQFYIIYANLVF